MKEPLPTQTAVDGPVDEIKIRLSRAGDDRAMERLIHAYKPMVRAKARSYYLAGTDNEDLVQEGMIGLFKAVRDYQEDRGVPFRAFADLCISRQIQTAVKMGTRLKHVPLNTYVSLNQGVRDEEADAMLLQLIPREAEADPAHRLIRREERRGMEMVLDSILSDLEKRVLTHYLNGIAYQDIARHLGKTTKSVDNALQRIKRKIERALDVHPE